MARDGLTKTTTLTVRCSAIKTDFHSVCVKCAAASTASGVPSRDMDLPRDQLVSGPAAADELTLDERRPDDERENASLPG